MNIIHAILRMFQLFNSESSIESNFIFTDLELHLYHSKRLRMFFLKPVMMTYHIEWYYTPMMLWHYCMPYMH